MKESHSKEAYYCASLEDPAMATPSSQVLTTEGSEHPPFLNTIIREIHASQSLKQTNKKGR